MDSVTFIPVIGSGGGGHGEGDRRSPPRAHGRESISDNPVGEHGIGDFDETGDVRALAVIDRLALA
jgi:hypothetical protein